MSWPLLPWPRLYIQVGVMSFVLAALLMPAAIYLLRRLGVIDEPADSKVHAARTVRGGGIVIFIAFAVAVLFPNYRDNPMKGVMVGAFICLVVGAIDDYRGGIPAVFKMGALLAATLIMSFFGVRLNLFDSDILDLLFTLLWIVGVTSAFNGLDNMDGLAAGIAVIVSAVYVTMAVESYYAAGQETSLAWFGLLAAGLIGANAGFLLYNFNPARVFMGDAGSFFLGFTLAALGVMGEWNENRVIACSVPVLILGVPIFDFAYILIARVYRGETRTIREIIEHCATDHLSHRLMWLGFSQRKAVLFIYLIGAVLGISGLLLSHVTTLLDSVLGLFQGLAIIVIIMVLMAVANRRHLAEVRAEVNRLPKADA